MDSTHIVNHAQLADWIGPERLLRLSHLRTSLHHQPGCPGGHLELSENFAWMATLPAVLALGTAVALEVAAYYLPLVDNLLDTIAAPAAVVAGAIVSASVFTDMSPVMKWSLALIAGGGAAGIVHASMALLRGGSTATTGGLGNPLISTVELGGAVGASILSLLVPGLFLVAVLILAGAGVRIWMQRRARVLPASGHSV